MVGGKKARILIMGDTVPTKSNYDLFINADVEELIGEELIKLLSEADYRIVNLETPLVDDYTPIRKWGINLYAPTNAINALSKLNINYVGLANNHIMDQGANGLDSTLKLARANGMSFSNVGENIMSALKGKIISVNDIKVGIYGCTEHEYSCADENRSGANPFDPLKVYDEIQNLKDNCDSLLVLYHGGKEDYRYPTPYLQKCCRKFVEAGADLVVCQHSHCIGCEEKYLEGTIIYGQGNFIFDYLQDEGWKNGLIIDWNISDLGQRVVYVPIMQKENRIRKATRLEDMEIMNGFYERSRAIEKKGFTNKEFDLLSKRWFDLYFKGICHGSLLQMEDYIKCEAHREIFLRGIQLEQEKKVRLLKMLLKKEIIIWGVGEWGDKVYNQLKVESIKIQAFCDNNKELWGKKKYDIEIVAPSELEKIDKSEYFVLVASIYEQEIEKQILKMEIKEYILLSDLRRSLLDV